MSKGFLIGDYFEEDLHEIMYLLDVDREEAISIAFNFTYTIYLIEAEGWMIFIEDSKASTLFFDIHQLWAEYDQGDTQMEYPLTIDRFEQMHNVCRFYGINRLCYLDFCIFYLSSALRYIKDDDYKLYKERLLYQYPKKLPITPDFF